MGMSKEQKEFCEYWTNLDKQAGKNGFQIALSLEQAKELKRRCGIHIKGVE